MDSSLPAGQSAADSGLRIPRRLWLVILLACTVVGILNATQEVVQGLLSDEGRVRWPAVVFQGIDWIILAAATPLTVYLARRFPLRAPRLGRSIAVHMAGALVLCVGWASAGVLLRRLLGEGWGPSVSHELITWALISAPWSFFAYFAILGAVHSFAYYLYGREQELRASRLSTQLADAKLSTLRAQLHPHFLFNTLNAISVLLRDNRVGVASRMVEGLGDLLRQVLRTDAPQQIALASELELVEKYLAIELVRFSDRLQVRYEIDASARKCLVPSFILQPLVENALRHGLAERTEGAVIEIGARRENDVLELWVSDNGPGMTDTVVEGIGLTNVRERLRTLYGEHGRLELRSRTGGVSAHVFLPCIEAQ